MFLSIIIPVYNVEKYLSECIESCLEQDIPSTDYEIICVDDASPDGCGKILDAYAEANDNIRVIHNSRRGGVSTARNVGIDASVGDYIWFVDSDDFLEKNVLGLLRDFIMANAPERIHMGLYHMKSDVMSEEETEKRKNGSLEPGACCLCGQMFKADIIRDKNIRFHSDVSIEEDTIFGYEYDAYQSVPTMMYKDRIFYFYRNNPNSLLHSDIKKMLPSFINMAVIMKNFKESNFGDTVYSDYSMTHQVYRAINVIAWLPAEERKRYMKTLKELGLFPLKPSEAAKKKFLTKNLSINKHMFSIGTTYFGYFVMLIEHKLNLRRRYNRYKRRLNRLVHRAK